MRALYLNTVLLIIILASCKDAPVSQPVNFNFVLNTDTVLPGEFLICKNESSSQITNYIIDNSLNNTVAINDSFVLKIPITQPAGTFMLNISAFYMENDQMKKKQEVKKIVIPETYGDIVIFRDYTPCYSHMLFIDNQKIENFNMGSDVFKIFPGCDFNSNGLYRMRLTTGPHHLKYRVINCEKSTSYFNDILIDIIVEHNGCQGVKVY